MLLSPSKFAFNSIGTISAGLVAVLLGLGSATVQADPWKVYGEASLETEFSDNKILALSNPDKGLQTTADLEVSAARVSRNNEIVARGQFEAVRYDGIEALNDEENLSLRLSGEHKANPVVTFGWYGQYARDTTSNRSPRTGSQVDENSEFDVDTGLTREQFRTRDVSIGSSINWQLSRKLDLNASYSFRDVRLPDRAMQNFGFFDFEQHAAQLRANYALDERHSFSLGVRASLFDSFLLLDGSEIDIGGVGLIPAAAVGVNSVETDTIGAVLGYRYDISENFYIGANAGVEKVETTSQFGLINSDDTEFVYRVFALNRGKRSQLLASFDRSVAPSGVGRLIARELARVVYTFRPAPRQTFRLRASYLSNDPIGDTIVRLEREFLTIEPGYSFAVNRRLSVGVDYRYRFRELRVEGSRSDNHAISANLRYRFGRE